MARLLDPRNGPSWDLKASRLPCRTWCVAAVPRTGSTLLCRAVWDTQRVGAPKEYLNPMQLRDWRHRLDPSPTQRWVHGLLRGPAPAALNLGHWSDETLMAYLDRLRRRRTGPTGWFGLKIHHHHFARWFGNRDPEDFLGPIRWVTITRRDKVAQAVSWARAVQTGRWAAHQRGWAPPLYDEGAIRRRLMEIERQEVAWSLWLRSRGLQPLELIYEDVVADLGGAVRSVLQHLGESPSDLVVRPGMQRQADATSQEWIARYRRSTGSVS